MVRGQCTQILMDKMKHDPNLDTARTSYNPLKWINLIEKTIFAQTEDQYPLATLYEQEVAFYSFHQHNLTTAPVVSNHGKLRGRARARGAGLEQLKDHRCMPC